jgi:hypothetical protein
MTTKRRICWPNPDATCLEGGCNHCKDHLYVAVTTIQRYAESAGVLPHRGNGEESAIKAFRWGLRYGWTNMDIK